MTGLLQKAIERAEALPQEDQDAIGAQILDLIDDEAAWERSFAVDTGKLRRMAEEAAEEHRQGLTRPMEDLLDE